MPTVHQPRKKSLMASLRGKWRGLRQGKPGDRFQHVYTQARRQRRSTPLWQRAFQVCLAGVAFVLGVIFAVLPGPAFIFFIMAGALLATESRSIAKLLDWLELRIRALWKWSKRHWRRLGLPGRIAVVTTGACGALGMAAFMGWMMFLR